MINIFGRYSPIFGDKNTNVTTNFGWGKKIFFAETILKIATSTPAPSRVLMLRLFPCLRGPHLLRINNS
jgi:hypothetical protein